MTLTFIFYLMFNVCKSTFIKCKIYFDTKKLKKRAAVIKIMNLIYKSNSY